MMKQQQQQSQFVIVTYPAQGHINPAFQFAERLVRLGVHVTFFTTIGAHSRGMIKSCPPNGLSFATFSDGYDDGVVPMDDVEKQWDQLKRNGSKALTDLIVSTANKQCIVYTMLLPWVVDVALDYFYNMQRIPHKSLAAQRLQVPAGRSSLNRDAMEGHRGLRKNNNYAVSSSPRPRPVCTCSNHPGAVKCTRHGYAVPHAETLKKRSARKEVLRRALTPPPRSYLFG
nr:crocetin glucosyltransferase, chloroplastic [Quercus suber]